LDWALFCVKGICSVVGVSCEGLEDQTVALLTAIGGSFFEGKMLLPCTIMMNNMESKRKRARKNQDTDLRGLTHMMNNMESKRESKRKSRHRFTWFGNVPMFTRVCLYFNI